MGRKPKIQTRVEQDTMDAIEDYVATTDDTSQSEAIRHLIRAGLAAKGHPVAVTDGSGRVRYVPDTVIERIASLRTLLAGTLLCLLGTAVLTTAALAAQSGALYVAVGLTGLSVILSVFGAGTILSAALANIALARPLQSLLSNTSEVSADVE